ncbi:hypothetical protein Pst134EB_010046 [Puccinia striiformis f. sp. tritici]|nr:hypothetical protein Pst134EB_010046 [Puccinia striiformis f. sp. tritici]
MDQRLSLPQNILTTQSAVLASSQQATLAVIQGGAAILQDEQQRGQAEAVMRKKRGGSRKGRSANLPRDFEEGYQRLCKDYFSENPIYSDYHFCRRFRMH